MPGPLYRNVHTSDGGILNVAALDLSPQQVLSTARLTPPQVGLTEYETDTFATMQYQSATTGWTPIWNLPWGLPAAPINTASNGTATAGGTVEIRDAVLGDYVFTAVANRIYKIHWYCRNMGTTVAGDVAVVRIRDGGASTPTTASTLLAQGQIYLAVLGGPGQSTLHVTQYATGLTAGTHTLSGFTVRGNGTGAETANGYHELYVEDMGPSGNPA